MKRSDVLKQERASKVEKLRGIATEAGQSGLTDEQRAQADTLKQEIENMDADIQTALFLEAEELERAKEAAKRTPEPKKTPEEKASEQYSFIRAIRMAASGKQLDGIEAEMSQEAEKEFKASGITPTGNLWIPSMLTKRGRERRDLTAETTTAGGFTVQTSVGDLIPFLDPRLAVIEAGATLLTGLTGNIDFPRNDAAATAVWEGENDANAETSPTFDRIQLSPNRLGAFTDISKQLMVQSTIDVENFVRNRLNFAINKALDYALINGDGSTQLITGILNTSGIGSVAIGTDGGPVSWANIVKLEMEVVTDDADFGRLAYLTTPGVRGFLKTTEKATGTAQFVWMDGPAPAAQDRMRVDMMNGYRAFVSTQVPSNLTKGGGSSLHAILFGNWEELIIGQWAGLDVVVDPYTSSKNALVTIVVNSWWDAALRHAASFAAIVDADTTSAV